MSKAKLPGLMPVATGNPALDRLLQAIIERLEVREGSRGDPLEGVVTQRDLKNMGLANTTWSLSGGDGPGVIVQTGNNTFAKVGTSEFSEKLKTTKLYRDLQKGLDDTTRFDDYPRQVRDLLLTSLEAEAKERGASIKRTETILQSATESLAMEVEEVTASIFDTTGGIRTVKAAFASEVAGAAIEVTQLEASLGNYYQDGAPGRAVLETAMSTTADAVTGLEGQYTVKINAGGAVAGFGLAATESLAGETTSSFIVQADKFAVISGSNPSQVPFGVDATGVYINVPLRVSPTGPTIQSLSVATGVYISYDTQFFKYSSAGVPSNSVVNLTANLTGSLTGFVTWSVLSGYTGTVPTAGTTNSWALAIADMTGDSASFLATKVDGASTYTDTITVAKLRDGTDSLTGLLTNESHVVPASSAGVVSAWTGAGGTFKVYRGLTDITTSCAFSIQTNSDTLAASIGASTGVYAVTAAGSWASGSSLTSITFRATFSGTTIDKTFSLSKSLAGIKGDTGDQGLPGDDGSPGSTGTRGTITTKITGAWSDVTANAQIATVATAAGATPTSPIMGDIVYYTGGAKEWSPPGHSSVWWPVAAFIDGSLVATGTIAAGKLASDISITTTGYLRADGAYNSAAVGYVAGCFNEAKTSINGLVAYSDGNAAAGYAIAGQQTGPYGAGIYGVSTHADSYGIIAQGAAGGKALQVIGTSTFSGAIDADSTINAVGDITAFGSSDIRLKKNIKLISNPLDKLSKLRGVSFDWRNKYIRDRGGEDGYFVRKHDVGVIAQEVRLVQPEIVGERKDGTLAVKYEKLVPLLIEAVKALHAKVKLLEAR